MKKDNEEILKGAAGKVQGKLNDIRQAVISFYNQYPEDKFRVDISRAKKDMTKFFILDIRPTEIYKAGHLPNSYNIPLMEIGRRFTEIPDDRDILIVCAVGVSAAQTAGLLNLSGKKAYSMSGGYEEWEEAEYTVTKE